MIASCCCEGASSLGSVYVWVRECEEERERETESSVTSKKSPNVYKSCPKMISQENE